ncbi:MAG TPA: response regulator, partial [Holophaga sp.]|nr:response regulator [Holophaga sp.]
MAHILLIDDDAILRETFGALMRRLGHAFTWAGSMEEGRAALARERVDVVLLDLRLPDGYGLDLMPGIKAGPGAPEVIIVTGQEDPEGAALAIKSGAWDYIQKPLTPNRVTLPLTRALEYRAQKAARRPRAVLKREAIVGVGPAVEA